MSQLELSVDDDDDVFATAEPLEMERDALSTRTFSRRETEPLAIVTEPVSHSSPRVSRRAIRDCDDDSAILIDDVTADGSDLDPDLVPAVRVEIFDDEFDLEDDFPSFHNNASGGNLLIS